MPGASSLTRRGVIGLVGIGLLAGCARDRFRLPPVVVGGAAVQPDQTIMQAIDASANHTRLAAALRASGLDEALAGPGPFTLLAPTDAAFGKIRPKADAEGVANDTRVLERVLRGHIIPARLSVDDIDAGIAANGGETKALGLNGLPVGFRRADGALRAFDTRRRRANVGPTSAIASNGLIHVFDEVMLPPEAEKEEAEKVSP